MNSDTDLAREPKDRTWLIWGGILLLVVVMLAAVYFTSGGEGNISRARVRHILVSFPQGNTAEQARAYEEIADLRERLEEGASFAELAREYSEDPSSARKGGDLGYETKGTFEAGFEEYVWEAPIGELSPIIETKFGYHLIIVEDRYITDADRFEMEVKERLEQEQQAED